ncbi:hypothetical protein [Micromonospora chokoriensis]|uniref:hypothetical protein n=1 Tax=Micromonospora chokoriensis TaxID=356851 RepID=UPI0004C314B4|nr:hypothetical protein [Micromonospora chokoriensis]
MGTDRRAALPDAETEAADWLRQYAARGRELDDLSTYVDVVIAARSSGLLHAVETLLQALSARRTIRAARTGRRVLGWFQSDWVRPLLGTLAAPALYRIGTALGVLAGLVLLLRPIDDRAAVQLAILAVALLFVGRRDRPSVVLVVLTVAGAVSVDPGGWWYCLLAVSLQWLLFLYRDVARMLRQPWWARGPILGMVPLPIRIRLLVTGRSTRLANAVDLATSARAGVAEPFVARCDDLPAAVEPMVEICRSLLALDKGDIEDALALAARATARERPMPDTVRGWCLAQLASLLAVTGNPEAGRWRREAIELLTPRSCRRYSRELLLAEAQQYVVAAPFEEAIRLIHHYRLMAVRRRQFDLLHLTEMWLVRLMITHGLLEEAAVSLEQLVGGEDGRTAMFSSRDETANDLLLRASVQLQRQDRARLDPRRDVVTALAMLDAGTRPLAATTGRLLLAKLDDAAGEGTTALIQAGSALTAAQHGRYMLPSAAWRDSWSRTQLDAHSTTLAMASAGGDSALVAEIIELTRGEVLPAVADARTLSALAALDATADDVEHVGGADSAEVAEEVATVAALQGLSPVRQPPRVRIGSNLRLPSLDPKIAEIGLDRELSAIGPRTWYWSAVTVLDDCYWAVRDPAGRWSHGRIPLSEGTPAAAAYGDLLDALPFSRPGEDAEQVRDRVVAGALGRSAGPQAELDLLARVAAAFLPRPLAEGLHRTAGDATLVVSLPTALGHLPVAGLPLAPHRDLRVIERAAVVHMPSWGVVHAARRSRTGPTPGGWPARLAIVAPHGDDDMRVLERPEGVDRIVRGPLTKQQCRDLLHAMNEDRAWLLTLIGHVDAVPGNTAAGGLRLTAAEPGPVDRLTMSDLVGTGAGNEGGGSGDAANRAFDMPERVVLIGCGSIGIGPPPSLIAGQTPASEWLGLGSAVVLAGASHVCCALYTVYASTHLKRMTDGLIAGLSSGTAPVSELRRVQLAELARWRDGQRTYPVLWLALAYVGTGWVTP